jgi:hypothetical protein
VLRAGGALEIVDIEAERLPLVFEFAGNHVAEFLGRFPGAPGGSLHVDAMLVGTGGEHGVEAPHALKALDRIRRDGGVGVADVRSGIDVVDGGRQVVFHFDSVNRFR